MEHQYQNRDHWIACTSDGIEIRGYYFPWGTKHIPYPAIRSVRQVEMAVFSGKGRIWGTTNPHYWAHLDPERPKKRVGFILDVGRFVHPFITPDDPDAVEEVLRVHSWLRRTAEDGGRGPVV